ncbi:hypothetical protein DZJ_00800 [Dickeya ananatis]
MTASFSEPKVPYEESLYTNGIWLVPQLSGTWHGRYPDELEYAPSGTAMAHRCRWGIRGHFFVGDWPVKPVDDCRYAVRSIWS